MGRNAQRGRQARRARRSGDLLRVLLRPLDPDSLWLVLRAAGASPGVAHRGVTLAHLVSRALRGAARGRHRVAPGGLTGLLDAAGRAEPALAMLEDHIPLDPTLDVRVRFENQVYRLFPGSMERPVADVARASLVADAIDDHLLGLFGFGVADYVRLVLREIDATLAVLAPVWPLRPRLRPGGPARLTASEVAAASRLPAVWQHPHDEADARVDRERAALAWASAKPDEIPYSPGDPNSSFDHYVGVLDDTGQVRALPLAFLAESWPWGVTVLAQAAADDPGCRQRFAFAAAQRLERALLRFGFVYGGRSAGGVVASPRNQAHCIVQISATRIIAVQLVTMLDIAWASLPNEPAVFALARQARQDREACRQGTMRVLVAGGAVEIPAGSEVIPLLVVATPSHLAVQARAGLAGMTLDDLTWISATADEHTDTDLYFFCRDLVELPGIGRLFGWETINLWELWRANGKAFHRGGAPVSASSLSRMGARASGRRPPTDPGLRSCSPSSTCPASPLGTWSTLRAWLRCCVGHDRARRRCPVRDAVGCWRVGFAGAR